jgi:hypothetical protein
MRAALQALIPFLIPFVLYFAWAWVARREVIADPRSAPWLTLSGAGVILSAAALLVFAEFTALEDGGTYVPARIENGRIVGGTMR